MKKIHFGLIGVLFLISCGGGGEGASPVVNSGPITNTRTYFLDDDGYYEPGYRLQFNLSGSTRDVLTGTYSISTKNKVTVSGQLLTPMEFLLNLTNITTGAMITSFSTKYFDGNHHMVMSISDNVTCFPTQTVNIPAIGKIGDFGPTAPNSCDDGTSTSGTWILEQGPGILAVYTVTSNLKDSTGDIIATEKDHITIDESGDPKSIQIELHYISLNATMILNGTRVLK